LQGPLPGGRAARSEYHFRIPSPLEALIWCRGRRRPSLVNGNNVFAGHSVVEPAGEDANLARKDLMHESMLLIDTSRPALGEFMLQRLRFARARKWFSLDLANQPNDPKCQAAVPFNPPSEVIERGRIKLPAFQRPPRVRALPAGAPLRRLSRSVPGTKKMYPNEQPRPLRRLGHSVPGTTKVCRNDSRAV
jgi:hypothetical protein